MSLPLLLIVLHVVLALLALSLLRRARLQDTARVLWAFLAVAVPWLGPAAVFIVAPDSSPERAPEGQAEPVAGANRGPAGAGPR